MKDNRPLNADERRRLADPVTAAAADAALAEARRIFEAPMRMIVAAMDRQAAGRPSAALMGMDRVAFEMLRDRFDALADAEVAYAERIMRGRLAGYDSPNRRDDGTSLRRTTP